MDTLKTHQLFDSEFSTMMLFKCTLRKYADELRNGYLYFGSPRLWIDIENKGSKGQGDRLEGVCASIGPLTNENAYKTMMSQQGVHSFIDGGYTFFRRDLVLDIPSICFYGLHNTAFVRSELEDGRTKYSTTISKYYFSDLISHKEKKDFKNVSKTERPVLVMIKNVNELFARIIRVLTELDIAEEDIIIAPIIYTNKYIEKPVFDPFPLELFSKDDSFKYQSEVRIIIKNQSERFKKIFNMHNRHINVGSLSDIIEIEEYYYKDMEVVRFGYNSVLFSMPEAKSFNINKMSFPELCNLVNNIVRCKTVNLILPEELKESSSYNDKLKSIIDLFWNKYKVILSFDGDKFNLSNVNDKLIKELEIYNRQGNAQNLWKNKAESILKERGAYNLLDFCRKGFDNPSCCKAAHYYAGVSYSVIGKPQEAIENYMYSYKNDYYPIESLSAIASILYENKQYDDSLKVYLLIREYLGDYDCNLLGNLGLCYLQLGEYDRAMEMFEKEGSINSKDGLSFFHIGMVYYSKGEEQKAKDYLIRAIKIAPNNPHYVNEYNRVFGE